MNIKLNYTTTVDWSQFAWECLIHSEVLINVWLERIVWHNRGYSLPVRYAAVQTDELSGCCSAGRGGRKAPTTQPEKDPHPGNMPFAELVPEKRNSYKEHVTSTCNLTQQFYFNSVHCRFDVIYMNATVLHCVHFSYLIGEENIKWEEKQSDTNNSSSCSLT